MRAAPAGAWLDAIEAELAQVVQREALDPPLTLRTIYVGGGTPSLLGQGVMAELRRRLEQFACWDPAAVEWTAEANPESFDRDLAEDWLAAGVNRLSLGAQTFHAPTLRWMGRQHGPTGPVAALGAAREAGFRNVSLDLIFGVPERLQRDFRADLERVHALAPEHVSLYGLTAEAATPLGRWVREGRERLATEEAYEYEYLLAGSRLVDAGYEHYEVSNLARPGHRSRHNQAYWEAAAYLGLGPGAHSYLPPVRQWNTRDWAAYAARLGAGESPRESFERVDAATSALERVWLGLRTTGGVLVASPEQDRLVEVWCRSGWAVVAEGRVRLTPRGWLLLDRLAVEFDIAAA